MKRCGIPSAILVFALAGTFTGAQKKIAKPPEAPAHAVTPRPGPADAAPLEGSGVPRWAEGYEGQAVLGLDGGIYDAYRREIIESVQRALASRGVYTGPVNGVLDLPTMKAIYAFQDAAGILSLCGVPTPRTRLLLEQGSHTDPTVRH